MGKFVPGGVKSVLMNRYRHIDRSRIQFDFVVERGSAGRGEYDEVLGMGARVYEVPSVSEPLAYGSELRGLFWENGYKIVHACLNTLNVFPMRAACKAGVPVRIAENLSTAHKGEPKTAIKRLLRPLNYRYPTAFAANSEFSAEWMYGARASECAIIRNAIDLEEFRRDDVLRKSVRDEMRWGDRFVVGHVGRFQYQKNHAFLVDVFREVCSREPGALLALVGYGALEDDIKDKVRRCGLEANVAFLGPRQDLPGLYNAFDCFVLPSFYEGLPVVAIEAQAVGLPCLLSSEITREAAVLESTEMIPLSAGPVMWAERVIAVKGLARVEADKRMRDVGYDARSEGLALARYYLDLLEQWERAHVAE